MLVNNETGVVQPIGEVAKIVQAHGGLLVVDAVQAAGRITLDINALGADFMIISSHKIGGPKGAGALVSRGEVLMPRALIHGGGQEKGHRSGTENSLAVIGFGAAAQAAVEEFDERNGRLSRLRERLEAGMRAAAPDVIIYGADQMRVSNTTFFTLPGLKAETGQIPARMENAYACCAGNDRSGSKDRRRPIQIRLRDRNRDGQGPEGPERRHHPLHLGQEGRAVLDAGMAPRRLSPLADA
jgi:cysteine desulfurase